MKKIILGILLILSLAFSVSSAEIDPDYVFTPEEMTNWSFGGATASVKDGYLSIVPSSDVVYSYSPSLGLDIEYIDGVNIVMEVITKDGSALTGNGLPIYLNIDSDTTFTEAHKTYGGVWSYTSGNKQTYNIDFSSLSFWDGAQKLNRIRFDPTYSGLSISEIRVYEISLTPGKPAETKKEKDPDYIFTPEELSSWHFGGADSTVTNEYLSIVPTKDIVYTYSQNLGLDIEYIDSVTIVMEIITKDGSTIVGNGLPIYTSIDEDTAFSEAHKTHASAWSYVSGDKHTYTIDFTATNYWEGATTLNQIRYDPTYSGLSVSEIRIYKLYFSPGKMIEAGTDSPDEVNGFSPATNIFTGTKNAFNFEDQTDASFFSNPDDKYSECLDYKIVNDPTSSGKGKMLEITLLDEPYNAGYAGANIYYGLFRELEESVDRPVLVLFDTKGKGQPVFWLGSNPATRGDSVKETWNTITIDNTSMSKFRIQFATSSACSKSHYIDNIAVYPYYRITYTLEYPDGTKGTDITKDYFDSKNISVSANGTVTGFPTSYTIEQIDAQTPGYKLSGWSTQKGADTPMTTVNLESKDIVLYPVWTEQDQTQVNLTLFLDENKTVSKTETVLSFSNYTLPTYDELYKYTPDGKIPLGFDVSGTTYAPGRKIIIPDGENLTISALYGLPAHPEYGELVFFEGFESFETGSHIFNAQTQTGYTYDVSYLNPDWTTDKSHFMIRQGDAKYNLEIVEQSSTNKVLEATKINASMIWPNFLIYNQNTSQIHDGYYTLCADFMAPEGEIGNVSGFYVRFYYNGKGESITSKANSKELVGGKMIHVSFDLPIVKGTEFTSIDRLQIFMTTNTADEDTFCYIDNVSLYYKKDHAAVKVSDTHTEKEFFIPGDTIRLPDRYEIAKYIPDGYELSGYSSGGKFYAPDSEYVTKEADSVIDFNAEYIKKTFSLKFKTGNANGTIAEIKVQDGDKVTLPDSGIYHPTLTLTGWKVNDEVYDKGSEFTFVYKDFKNLLDGTDRLIFSPAFTGTDPTNYGFITEITVPSSENVTFETLVKVADELYYGVRRTNPYGKTVSEKLSDMVSKGIVPEYADLSANITYEDVAFMLSNVLPESFYDELCFYVEADVSANALKLIRAGIIDESTDFTKNVSSDELSLAVEKLMDEEKRTVENKRTFYVIGDSLTAGMGWPQYLPDPHLTGNIVMVNHGINSMNTSHYISRNGGDARTKYLDMMPKINKGDYVIIALGTNDSTLWKQGSMTYNQSRDNYYRLVTEIRAQGGVPFLVCPVGRNTTDENGNYIESDPLIIECMMEANELYSLNVPIINFKSISLERMSAMTAEQRAEIYIDEVHYKPEGGKVVASWFAELMTASDNVVLSGFRNHFVLARDEDKNSIILEPKTNSTLFIATYSQNGRMTDIRLIPVSADTPIEVYVSDNQKAFLLDDKMMPIIEEIK